MFGFFNDKYVVFKFFIVSYLIYKCLKYIKLDYNYLVIDIDIK